VRRGVFGDGRAPSPILFEFVLVLFGRGDGLHSLLRLQSVAVDDGNAVLYRLSVLPELTPKVVVLQNRSHRNVAELHGSGLGGLRRDDALNDSQEALEGALVVFDRQPVESPVAGQRLRDHFAVIVPQFVAVEAQRLETARFAAVFVADRIGQEQQERPQVVAREEVGRRRGAEVAAQRQLGEQRQFGQRLAERLDVPAVGALFFWRRRS